MPGLSCEETLRRLVETGANVPVVVMSGHAEAEVRERFAAFDVAGFLPKPFTGGTLRTKLEQVLRLRPA
jgi:FixJ family two-component response regulator